MDLGYQKFCDNGSVWMMDLKRRGANVETQYFASNPNRFKRIIASVEDIVKGKCNDMIDKVGANCNSPVPFLLKKNVETQYFASNPNRFKRIIASIEDIVKGKCNDMIDRVGANCNSPVRAKS